MNLEFKIKRRKKREKTDITDIVIYHYVTFLDISHLCSRKWLPSPATILIQLLASAMASRSAWGFGGEFPTFLAFLGLRLYGPVERSNEFWVSGPPFGILPRAFGKGATCPDLIDFLEAPKIDIW